MSSSNTAPTAQMPMPGGPQQQQLLSLLEDYETCWEISHKLPDVAFELRNDSIVKARKFGPSQLHSLPEYDDGDRMKMLKLLLSMDRTVIRAIIRGTVAHDTFHNRTAWLGMPGPMEKVPGVYVIGLSRDGCDGEFLNVEEMKELILGIRRYIKGFEFINQRSQAKWSSGPGIAPLSAFQQGLVDWVKKVDGVSTPSTLDGTQYIEQDSVLPSIQALLSMFESWCRTSLDPTQKVRQISSPLFVGFSVEVNATMATCDQAQLLSMNKPNGTHGADPSRSGTPGESLCPSCPPYLGGRSIPHCRACRCGIGRVHDLSPWVQHDRGESHDAIFHHVGRGYEGS